MLKCNQSIVCVPREGGNENLFNKKVWETSIRANGTIEDPSRYGHITTEPWKIQVDLDISQRNHGRSK